LIPKYTFFLYTATANTTRTQLLGYLRLQTTEFVSDVWAGMAKGSSLPLCSETSCLTYLWRLPSEWIVLAVVVLPLFVTGTTDVLSLISNGENSIVSVSVSLHTHVSYKLDRKSAFSRRKQDSNNYGRRSQAVSSTVREILIAISVRTRSILGEVLMLLLSTTRHQLRCH
jgi:hypothetical protein